jgi:heme oxygenase
MANLPLSEQLKENTQTNHQALEKQVILLIKAIQTPDDYGNLINLFYSYFGGVELLVDSSLKIERIPDYPDRRKTASLSHDLFTLGIAKASLAVGNDLPQINNHLQAIGAMYVMEGSTLGGVHISKMIQQRLPSLDEQALTFFNGYRSDTQAMWQKFKTAIDGEQLQTGEAAYIIQSANETFIKFANWITRSERIEVK